MEKKFLNFFFSLSENLFLTLFILGLYMRSKKTLEVKIFNSNVPISFNEREIFLS